MEFIIAIIVSLAINITLFIPAFIYKTDKLTDLSYSISFIILALITFLGSTGTLFHIVLLSIITIWALRLGIYLLIRIRKISRDKRFDGVRENFWKFLKFWVLQALAVWVILLPSISIFSIEEPVFNTLAYIGLTIWLLGLIIETFADYQKYTFINNEKNKGMWIDSGLWKYSRHPNYLGEMMIWIGVYIFTLSSLVGILPFVMLASPLFIIFLLLFGSGIPMLEKGADKRWGDNPKYQAYKKRVGVLLPKLF